MTKTMSYYAISEMDDGRTEVRLITRCGVSGNMKIVSDENRGIYEDANDALVAMRALNTYLREASAAV